MKYRYATILPEKTLDASGTELIPIRLTQPISRLDLKFRVTKGLASMAFAACHDVTKIELVDGSDVLHGLTGYENQALCIYDRRTPTMSEGWHLIANDEVSLFGIDFGRWLWDRELAFDPTRFKNPQLKVTYTRAIVDTSASACYLSVHAHIFDEKEISPLGFLMSKEQHNAATPDNDSYKYVDLPTDFPMRKILIRAYEADTEPWAQVEGVRIDEDNEKRIPFDMLMEDYYRLMKGIWAPVEEQHIAKASAAGQTTYCTPTDYSNCVALTPIGVDDTCSLDGYPIGGKVKLASATLATCIGIVRGYLPHHTFEFPFGDPKDIEDWYDVSKVGSLRLRVRGGATGTSGEFQVVIQQLRRY